MKKFKLYTDGSFQEKLGIAAIGGYLTDNEGNVVSEFSEKITDANSFKFHETLAIYYGLKKALEHGVTDLECFSDYVTISDIFNQNTLKSQHTLNNPYLKNVMELKNQFSSVEFHHLPRKKNKKADKLAGKTLQIYKEDEFKFKKRSAFTSETSKLVYVDNLKCEEDFQEINNVHEFAVARKALKFHYLLEITREDNITLNCYLITRNPKNFKQVNSTLLGTETIEQSHTFSKSIGLLIKAFSESIIEEDVGLMFNGPNALRKVEMVLRRRATLNDPNTPLMQNFLSSIKKFPTVYLHNDEKLIKEHNLLIGKDNKIKNELDSLKDLYVQQKPKKIKM